MALNVLVEMDCYLLQELRMADARGVLMQGNTWRKGQAFANSVILGPDEKLSIKGVTWKER